VGVDDGLGFTPDTSATPSSAPATSSAAPPPTPDDGLGFTADSSTPAPTPTAPTAMQTWANRDDLARSENTAGRWSMGVIDAGAHAVRGAAGALAGSVAQVGQLSTDWAMGDKNSGWGSSPDSPDRKAAQAVHDAVRDETTGTPYTVEGKKIVTSTNKMLSTALDSATDPETYQKIDKWARQTFGPAFTTSVEQNMRLGPTGLSPAQVAGMATGIPKAAQRAEQAAETAAPVATANAKVLGRTALDAANLIVPGAAAEGAFATDAARAKLFTGFEEPRPAGIDAERAAATPPAAPDTAVAPTQTPPAPTAAPKTAPSARVQALAAQANGEEPPAPASGPATPAASAPTTPQTSTGNPAGDFNAALQANSEDHPTDPTMRRLGGNTSVQIQPDPGGDPSHVRVAQIKTDDASAPGGAALSALTALADQHNTTLDMAPDAVKPEISNAHGFESSSDNDDLTRPPMGPTVNAPPLEGLPQELKLNGKQTTYGPSPTARTAAYKYMQTTGRPYDPPATFEPIVPSRGKMIANAYDQMQHTPDDPETAASYKAMIKENNAMWKGIEKTGLKVEFMKQGQPDPYNGNPRLATLDVRNNNHLWVYPTEGTGTQSEGGAQDMAASHPLNQPTNITVDGRKLVANDVFRIVHDYYGHVKEGNGFRANGEFNAYRIHKAMYSPLAQKAVASETLGQNAWVNFGPHGEANKNATAAKTVYAEQKAGLLPDHIIQSADIPASTWIAEEAKQKVPPEVQAAATQSQGGQIRSRFQLPKEERAGVTRTPAQQADAAMLLKDVLLPHGLKEVRRSAIEGDFHEIGNEHETAKLPGTLGTTVRGAIDNEQNAMRDAVASMGSTPGAIPDASTTATTARGAVFADSPDTGVKHFKVQDDALYTAALQAAAKVPANIQPFLDYMHKNEPRYIGPAEAVHKGMLKAARKMGMTDDKDQMIPGAVSAERIKELRDLARDQYVAGNTGKLTKEIVSSLNDSLAASTGNPRIMAAADANRKARGEFLERNDAINEFLPPDNGKEASREVQLDKIMPKLFGPGTSTAQFHGVVNALADVSHYFEELSKGKMGANDPRLKEAAAELATKNSRTMTALRDQFVADALDAAQATGGKFLHAKLAQFLQDREGKMTAIWTKAEMAKWEKIAKAGNILGLDRTYKGAHAQEATTSNLRKRMAQLGEGALSGTASVIAGHSHPLVAPAVMGVIEMSGLGGKIRTKLEGDAEGKAARAYKKDRIVDLENYNPRAGAKAPVPGTDEMESTNAPPAKGPLGADIGGGKQRGAVGVLNKKKPAQQLLDSNRELKKNLTPEERKQAAYRQDVARNVIKAFTGAPAVKEYAAATLAGAAARGWYKDSAATGEQLFGPDYPRFAGLLAAMSPQTSVQMNFHNALRTFINWDNAGRPQTTEAITKIMQKSSLGADRLDRDGPKPKSNVLEAWVNNSVDALTHPDPEKMVLSGPKVHSFYQNLRNNANEVTNDSHMAKFASVLPKSLGGSRTSMGPGKSAPYLGLSARTRQAAVYVSKMLGEKWTPAEVQEAVWSFEKRASEIADEMRKQGKNVSIQDLIHSGAITDELIRSVPSFHQLFSSPEHAEFLKSSQYAGNAGRLANAPVKGPLSDDAIKTRAAAQESLRPSLISAAKRLDADRAMKLSAKEARAKADASVAAWDDE
jgi:hypothetical protein